ncbi:uncharacterized protein LOC142337253 isoform X2 [Convolutriloba macropyga]
MQDLSADAINILYSGLKRKQRNVDIVTYKIGNTPKKLAKGPDATELLTQKENFLNHGLLPDFTQLEKKKTTHNKGKGEIRFELFNLSRKILETVREEFVNGELFMNEAFGHVIEKEHASKMIRGYLDTDPILSSIKVAWSQDITGSAVMVTRGPISQPEKRKYTMVIKDDPSMPYLRTEGILALAHHEVGTHFVRFYNDALQPWSGHRQSYKLRKRSHVTGLHTEEGLATLASLFAARCKYLYKPALLYYIACMSTVMGFRELYEHIGGLEPDPDLRWRLVYRVKRAMESEEVGGYGKDQCYLAGAVKILLNRKRIDFPLLFTGKLCYDEVDKVKRIIRKDGCLKPPYFADMSSYYKHLDQAFQLNCLAQIFPDFLQCPTIRCPAPIKCDFSPEPLDFLPLTKERRNQLDADKAALELKLRTTSGHRSASIDDRSDQNDKSFSIEYNTQQTFSDSSSQYTAVLQQIAVPQKSLISCDDLIPVKTGLNTNMSNHSKQFNAETEVDVQEKPSKSSRLLSRRSADLPKLASVDSVETSPNKKPDRIFEKSKRSFRLRMEKPPPKSAKVISVNDLRSKFLN